MSEPSQFEEMMAKAKAGHEAKTTVRTLLSWFGMYRRTYWNVYRIRTALKLAGVTTSPDFEGAFIDGVIDFVPVTTSSAPPQVSTPEEIHVTDNVEVELVQNAVQLAEPPHRISRLRSANTKPLSVPPDATIEDAITLMLHYDYSQLPVMHGEREVKGLLSWRSLGARLACGKCCTYVRDGMNGHKEIASDGSLFEAVRIIAEHDCVLVRADDNTICGIVTAYDISFQFQELAEPFLLLGDIENHIRFLIGNAFTVEDLQQARDPEDSERSIEDISDLTFGEYVRLLQNEENWAKLNIRIDRRRFIGWLDKVREIRNDIMHFDPDPMDPADLGLLRNFARFLVRRHQLTA